MASHEEKRKKYENGKKKHNGKPESKQDRRNQKAKNGIPSSLNLTFQRLITTERNCNRMAFLQSKTCIKTLLVRVHKLGRGTLMRRS
jgi:hypothetical protein